MLASRRTIAHRLDATEYFSHSEVSDRRHGVRLAGAGLAIRHDRAYTGVSEVAQGGAPCTVDAIHRRLDDGPAHGLVHCLIVSVPVEEVICEP